jgi:putative addiction module component (TIGR02574 family)
VQRSSKPALGLPVDEREKLLEELSGSLRGTDALSAAWEAEIAGRLRKLDAGEATFTSAEEVFEEADTIVRVARATR